VIIERVKSIITKPKETWELIKSEPATISQVMISYVVPLALIPAIFGIIGRSLIGRTYHILITTVTIRVPIGYSIVWAIVWYILTLIGLYIEGMIINALAPTFDSKKDMTKAFKLAAYSATPGFIAGVLNIWSPLGILVFLISLYGLYLAYLGLPILMETPKEKVVSYIIVVIIIMIVVYVVIGAIASAILSAMWSPHLLPHLR